MPTYKCGKDGCRFETGDISALIDHKIEDHAPKATPLEFEAEGSVPIRHRKVEDYLNCPECRPKFDEAYKKMGWAPQPKPEEKKKAEGGLGI